MPSNRPAAFCLTLFIAVTLALSLSQPVEAYGHLNHRNHAHSQRMIKQRAPALLPLPPLPQLLPNPVGGAAPDPSITPTDPESTGSASSSSPPSQSSLDSSTSSSSSSSSSTQSDSSAKELSTSSSSTTSESSSTTPPPQQTSEVLAATAAEEPSVTDTPPAESSGSLGTTFVTQIENVNAPSPSDSPSIAGGASQNSTAGTTLTVIIAVAASIGGIILIWTVFRKWKLARSSNFDKRLEPITSWQPTNEDDPAGAPHRTNSITSSGHGHGGARSDNGHGASRLQPLPDHDFTAGHSLNPVGGYADLARGPSPQPQMQEARRGPGYGAGGYDANIPLHHQAGYSNNGGYTF